MNEILKKWKNKCIKYSDMHRKTSLFYRILDKSMFIIVILISGGSGTTSFYNNFSDGCTDKTAYIVNGILNLVITLILSIQIWLNPSSISENHKNSFIEFNNIIDKIDLHQNKKELSKDNFIDKIKIDIRKTLECSPLIPICFFKENVEIDGEIPYTRSETNLNKDSLSQNKKFLYELGRIDEDPQSIVIH